MKKFLYLTIFLLGGLNFSSAQTNLQWTEFKPHMFLCHIEPYHNKSIIVEFKKFLVLIEAPQNDTIGAALIALCKEKFQNKPIKYLSHSHHHSHSIGSIDPFIKTGTTLITSPYNFNHIKKLSNDTVALLKKTILLDSLTPFKIKDQMNELNSFVVYQNPDKAYFVPTPEYVLHYLPNNEAFISGCLYNKPLTYHEILTRRKPTLKKIIEDNKLAVNYLIPTNTTGESKFEDICTFKMLEETLIQGINPFTYTASFNGLSLEYLNANIDSIAIAFDKKIDNNYDLLVLGNLLISAYKDYDRALILFHIAERLFPAKVDNYYYLTDTYWKKGDVAQSKLFLEKGLRFFPNDADLKELEKELFQSK